jgi:hypothetical protein
VPADTYIYRGHATLGYPDYADRATGRMLIAEPGGTYQIRACADGLPMPPGGPWEAVTPPPPPVAPVPAAAPKTGTSAKGGE